MSSPVCYGVITRQHDGVLKKVYFESFNSSYLRKYMSLFASINSLTASFQALFIGSLLNLIWAISLKVLRSDLYTVAAVLVSSEVLTLFVFLVMLSTLSPPFVFMFIYLFLIPYTFFVYYEFMFKMYKHLYSRNILLIFSKMYKMYKLSGDTFFYYPLLSYPGERKEKERSGKWLKKS